MPWHAKGPMWACRYACAPSSIRCSAPSIAVIWNAAPSPRLLPPPLQVGAIWGSTRREPTTVGKPAEFMLDNIATQFGLRKDQICMVGDRLDTDILFGKNGGLTTCLVLSGKWGREMRGMCCGGLAGAV
jgi:hypothetical protein